jgi:hypothetical protein
MEMNAIPLLGAFRNIFWQSDFPSSKDGGQFRKFTPLRLRFLMWSSPARYQRTHRSVHIAA